MYIKCNKINKQPIIILNQTVTTGILYNAPRNVFHFQIVMMGKLCIKVLVNKLSSLTSLTHYTQLRKTSSKQLIQKIILSNHFTLNELQCLDYNKENYFPLFRTKSQQYHFNELQTFLSTCLINFQVTGSYDSRIKTGIPITSNIQHSGFKF